MKVLAIDFGLKRSGIAISDDAAIFAFGLDTIPSQNLEKYLKQTVAKESVATIVLGEPKRLNMSDSHITENVRLLFEAIQSWFPTLTVVLHDERFTSKMAAQSIAQGGGSKKMKGNKGLIDQVSATILLQSYLSAQSH